jgi:hypothetical protein
MIGGDGGDRGNDSVRFEMLPRHSRPAVFGGRGNITPMATIATARCRGERPRAGAAAWLGRVSPPEIPTPNWLESNTRVLSWLRTMAQNCARVGASLWRPRGVAFGQLARGNPRRKAWRETLVRTRGPAAIFSVQFPIDGDLPAVLALTLALWPWAAPSGWTQISSPSRRFGVETASTYPLRRGMSCPASGIVGRVHLYLHRAQDCRLYLCGAPSWLDLSMRSSCSNTVVVISSVPK